MKRFVYYVHEVRSASVAVEAETEAEARAMIDGYIAGDMGRCDVFQALDADWDPDIEVMEYVEAYSCGTDVRADVKVNF